jgi:SAM-dependent methyltransferase
MLSSPPALAPGATGPAPASTPDWGCRLIERQSEFQRAKRVLEIGGGDFARAISLASRYPDKEVITLDFRYEQRAQENAARAAPLRNISFIKLDILEPFFAAETFDFVFSIAVMEHVPQVEILLRRIHALLRPRGVYVYFQAPFWTCKNGHHFNHSDPEVRRILDSYQHVRFCPDEMKEHLSSFHSLPFDADECIRKIYRRPDLSRLSPRESRTLAEASDLVVVGWEERLDRGFDEVKAIAAMQVHGSRYAIADFQVDAVLARLLKR